MCCWLPDGREMPGQWPARLGEFSQTGKHAEISILTWALLKITCLARTNGLRSWQNGLRAISDWNGRPWENDVLVAQRRYLSSDLAIEGIRSITAFLWKGWRGDLRWPNGPWPGEKTPVFPGENRSHGQTWHLA